LAFQKFSDLDLCPCNSIPRTPQRCLSRGTLLSLHLSRCILIGRRRKILLAPVEGYLILEYCIRYSQRPAAQVQYVLLCGVNTTYTAFASTTPHNNYLATELGPRSPKQSNSLHHYVQYILFLSVVSLSPQILSHSSGGKYAHNPPPRSARVLEV
jgi:hypothetical protein